MFRHPARIACRTTGTRSELSTRKSPSFMTGILPSPGNGRMRIDLFNPPSSTSTMKVVSRIVSKAACVQIRFRGRASDVTVGPGRVMAERGQLCASSRRGAGVLCRLRKKDEFPETSHSPWCQGDGTVVCKLFIQAEAIPP